METMALDEMDDDNRRKRGREVREDTMYDQIKTKEQEIRELREEIRKREEQIRELREEMKRVQEDIAIASGPEVRMPLEATLQFLRMPLEATLQFLRQETTSIRQEISSIRQEIGSRDQQISTLQQEIIRTRSVQEASALADPRASAMIRRSDPMKGMIAVISESLRFPRIDELDSFLKTNPLPSGFPISLDYFHQLAPGNTMGLFKTEDSDHFCKKLDSYLAKVLEPAQTGSTEDSFHQFWDELVNDFVQLFCVDKIFRDRNTSRDRSSGNFRPDVIGQLGTDWALWRGEEKSESTAGDPKKELLDKLTWVYGQIPYIFAYYARGATVTLVALYMVEGTKKLRKLGTFNLSTLVDRVEIILACLNVARLLPRLSSLCEDYCVEAEFKVLGERGGKQVRLYGSSVKKLYQSQAVFGRVVHVYERIRGCPNTEQVVTCCLKDGVEIWHSIVFQPRCSGLQRARPESELVKALVCVAKALVWLHERSIMHRDIRWPNIGHFQEEWILLDFDEACVSPQSEAHRSLCPENHAPETCTGKHDCSVDIWGIGHLIRTSKILGLAPKLFKLRDRCLDRNPSLRPSALYCYEELSSLICDGLV